MKGNLQFDGGAEGPLKPKPFVGKLGYDGPAAGG